MVNFRAKHHQTIATGFITRSDTAREGPADFSNALAKKPSRRMLMNVFKILIMKKMTKRRTKYMKPLTKKWMNVEKLEEAREKEESEKYRAERPKIQQQFADLKRGLAAVTDDEWANLPEIGDLRRKPICEHIRCTTKVCDIKKSASFIEFCDFDKSKTRTGWIASARLEEVAGKLSEARTIIAKGCEECSKKNEDVLLEAARLNNPESARTILANTVQHLPQSVKIWLHAVNLETDMKGQKQVLRRAQVTELVPLSVDLWLALARLETYENAKKVLNCARTCDPTSHEVWIAAARLEEQQGNEKMIDKIINHAVTVLSEKR
ncbi:Pre-mRNA-processing factor 6 [Gigaspora margarita]|uniref:Pre-mRNA-processing factor 6 n=1 Tax=Gigaspora margarita TaxID=4874 RepID=A0A8H4ERE9_GIGMA|nr:Pre-mRNA-processing factor 6 [Gigaspora margarita]